MVGEGRSCLPQVPAIGEEEWAGSALSGWGLTICIPDKCPRDADAAGRGAHTLPHLKTVTKQTSFYCHHVPTVPNTVVVISLPAGPAGTSLSLVCLEQPRKGIQKGLMQERNLNSSTWEMRDFSGLNRKNMGLAKGGTRKSSVDSS